MSLTISNLLLQSQSDARLVQLAGIGYERAFEVIVKRYREPLHRYCRRLFPEQVSEEAIQQAFTDAWSALVSGTEVRELRPWLYRITYTSALRALRKREGQCEELPEFVHGADSAEVALERNITVRETFATLAGLPERQREALVQTAIEGRSQDEVAHRLDVTKAAAAQLVHRARLAIRAAATALTPLPVATRIAAMGSSGEPVAQRIGELAASASGAGVAGVLAKAGVVVIGATTFLAGPVALHAAGHDGDRAVPSAQASHASGASANDAVARREVDASSGESTVRKSLRHRRSGAHNRTTGPAATVPPSGSEQDQSDTSDGVLDEGDGADASEGSDAGDTGGQTDDTPADESTDDADTSADPGNDAQAYGPN